MKPFIGGTETRLASEIDKESNTTNRVDLFYTLYLETSLC